MGILGSNGSGLGYKKVKLHSNKPPTFLLSYPITNEKTVNLMKVDMFIKKVKVKSSMARSLPVENLLPQNVGSIVNYLQ